MWESPSPIAAVFRQPRSIIVAIGLDFKSVAFPVANGVAHPSRFRWIVGKLSSIGPYRAPIVAPFEELNDPVFFLKKLKTIVVCKQTRISERIAPHHGIFGIGKGNAKRAVFCSRGLILFVSPRGEWGDVFHIQFDSVIAPYSVKIVWIESVAIDFLFFTRLRSVLWSLAPGTQRPARRRRCMLGKRDRSDAEEHGESSG